MLHDEGEVDGPALRRFRPSGKLRAFNGTNRDRRGAAKHGRKL
jgi:hypothetical protein